MVMRVPSVVVSLLLGTALANAQPAPPVSLELPAGYSNERTATDPAKPQPAAAPGALQTYSTLHSLGFEWDLGRSDTNHNATCRVEYRRGDEAAWHEALPLFRVDYAGWYADRAARASFNMLAGSVMFLRPGTSYVVKLRLADPDGGGTEREVQIATWPVPEAGPPARTLHVVPRAEGDTAAAGDGSPEKPFRGVEQADKAARPGDLLLLHAGDYGQATLRRSGRAASEGAVGAQPTYIAWRPAGDGPVRFARVDVTGSHLWLEGLQFHRGDDATGLRAREGAEGVVLRANIFRGYGYAIFLDKSVRRWYIADNDIVGDDAGGIAGEGIELNHSSDHTVCYNRITKTADGVSYCDTNCDIFANHIFDYSDDGVEPDYGYANNRIWGNRMYGPMGITFQAMFCGPWYIVRNQVVASNNIFKLRVQDRYLVANNTLVGYGPTSGSKVSHAHGLLTAMTRNNLWIHGGGSPTLWSVQVPLDEKNRDYMRRFVIFSTLRADWRTDVDYDGFDWTSLETPRNRTARPFVWNGAVLPDLAALAERIGIERHGRKVNKEQTFADYSPPPYDYAQPLPVLLLKPDGDAVDAGVPLPNIAEEFRGQSPDLGAFEAGDAAPHVGPRTDDWRRRHDDWVLQHQREAANSSR